MYDDPYSRPVGAYKPVALANESKEKLREDVEGAEESEESSFTFDVEPEDIYDLTVF